jgi:hypothetical protein
MRESLRALVPRVSRDVLRWRLIEEFEEGEALPAEVVGELVEDNADSDDECGNVFFDPTLVEK